MKDIFMYPAPQGKFKLQISKWKTKYDFNLPYETEIF